MGVATSVVMEMEYAHRLGRYVHVQELEKGIVGCGGGFEGTSEHGQAGGCWG